MFRNFCTDTIPTLQGAAGMTLLNIMPSMDPSAIAQIIIVLVTTITQLITLLKKPKLKP